MTKLKVVGIEEKGRQGRLNIFDIIYYNKENKEKKWNLFSRNNKEVLEKELFENYQNVDGISIYAIHKPTNKLVIIKEFRVAINDYIYTLPAGISDPNETPEDTAKRELYEETGLTIKQIIKVDKPRYSAVGLTNEKVIMVSCIAEGEINKNFQSVNEDAEILLIDVYEAQRILNDEKIAGRTALILENYILQCQLDLYKKDKPTIGFDMDVVLADFNKGFLQILNKRLNSNYTLNDLTKWNFKELFGDIANEILQQPGFFLELEPNLKMIEVLKYFANNSNYDIVVLTACQPQSFIEKVEWMEKLVPGVTIIPISNKDAYGADLLIDDSVYNLENFRRKKILVDAPYNKNETRYTRISDDDSVSQIIDKIERELR